MLQAAAQEQQAGVQNLGELRRRLTHSAQAASDTHGTGDDAACCSDSSAEGVAEITEDVLGHRPSGQRDVCGRRRDPVREEPNMGFALWPSRVFRNLTPKT